MRRDVAIRADVEDLATERVALVERIRTEAVVGHRANELGARHSLLVPDVEGLRGLRVRRRYLPPARDAVHHTRRRVASRRDTALLGERLRTLCELLRGGASNRPPLGRLRPQIDDGFGRVVLGRLLSFAHAREACRQLRGLPQLLVSLPQGLRKVALVRLLRHLGALRNNLAFREEGLRRLDFVGQDLGRLVERARVQVDLDG